ncbi:MAG TPA: ABC transporter permease [Gemmatimonadaceae bacterium]|jgi:predicted permease
MTRWDRIRRVLRLSSVERDVDDEIRFHLESRVADLIRRGSTAEEARRVAEREFGDVSAARAELAVVGHKVRANEARAARRDALLHDLRFSARSLLHARTLSAMVIVLLALGVGANVATLAVAEQLFLRQPSGVRNPDGLHRLVLRTNESVGKVVIIQPEVSYAQYRVVTDAVGSRAMFAAYTHADSIDSRIGGVRSFIRVSYSTPDYFPLLGARFARGRAFSESEGRMGAAERVAVVSYDLWQSRFNGEDAAIGKTIEVGGERFTVIGVAERAFNGIDLDRADLWLPFATTPMPSPDWYQKWRVVQSLRMLARPTAGVSMDQIAATATIAFRAGGRRFDSCCSDTTATIVPGPLLEALGPSVTASPERAIAPRLIGVALIVLIVACANVANLLLLRGLQRHREVAVRLALGISKHRLIRQIVLESLSLASIAAVVAVLVGSWGATLLRAMVLPSVHWATPAWNAHLLLTAIPTALVTGLVAGIAPASAAFDQDVATALKAASRSTTLSRSRLRVGLIVLQGALSVVLLIGAGLFIRSFNAVRSIDVGYDLDEVSYGYVMFRDSVSHYVNSLPDGHLDELANGLRNVATRLAQSPNVQGVALSSAGTPMAGYLMVRFYDQNRQPVERLNNLDPVWFAVTPEYFTVTGMRLVRGRYFTDADGPDVTLIDETAARVAFPNQDPLGKCLIIVRPTSSCSTVIGVVRDTHVKQFIESQVLTAFTPLRGTHPSSIIVRAKKGRGQLAMAELRREIERELSNAEPPYVKSVQQAREPELRPWRLGATLFGVFGVVALLVATIGIYSVMAFIVGQRTRELGVRIALGAQSVDIGRLVTVQAVWPVVVGIGLGIVLALASGRLIAGMLFGVTVADPTVIGVVAGLLMIAALLGALGPVLRATRVSPVEALRAE